MGKSLLIIGLCGQSVFLRVPHFHRPEETLHASSLFMEPGGKGYNQAVAARRMGAEVVFCGAVGRDADGACCEKRLEEEGIAPRMAYKDGATAYAAILTDGAGENRVTVYPGVRLCAADVEALEGDIVQAGMLLLTPEIPEEAFAKAMAMAKENSVPVVVNPAPYVPWVKPYLADAWLITPNRSEACALLECGGDMLEAAVESAPYPRKVVTLGGAGALCRDGGCLTRIDAPSVAPVDTTGAGDCLNGALCALLLEGTPLMEAVRMAVRAASISVTRAHALDGMPYRQECE
ncbi:MAG: ribokinase [Clostridia bacterium]|nr:ribokinase [Clostridia bacterium]